MIFKVSLLRFPMLTLHKSAVVGDLLSDVSFGHGHGHGHEMPRKLVEELGREKIYPDFGRIRN